MQRTFTDICQLWPDDESLSNAVRVKKATAQKWRYRNWIPAEYWLDVIDAAACKRRCVTLRELATAASQRR